VIILLGDLADLEKKFSDPRKILPFTPRMPKSDFGSLAAQDPIAG
jgi:hypothetical protein